MPDPHYVYPFEEGSQEMLALLGGKGTSLAVMTGLLGAERVPAGFTVTTEACVAYMRAGGKPPPELDSQVREALDRLEERTGKRLGDADDPLLVSVRSGARISMPGMLETVLNLGLNDESVEGLAQRTSNPRFAWDSYRRFAQMFGSVVRGLPNERFEAELRALPAAEGDAAAESLRELTVRFKEIYRKEAGEDFPQDPAEQLRAAIAAVFDSWNGAPAVAYRRLNAIPDDLGTAVNVQQMVFGNKGEGSGSGVAFSRDETTGEPQPSGSFLANAQGEDVVAGTYNTQDLDDFGRHMPEAHAQLLEILATLERHHGDMQDVEFTVEEGRLYLLQSRVAKRPAQAAVRFASDAVGEGLLDRARALATIDADSLESLLHPIFDPAAEYSELARGVPASPGAARGAIVLSAAEAVERGERGEDVILVRPFTQAEDVAGFHAARGIVTAQGGKSSHAALVARGMGRPCVSGVGELEIDAERGVLSFGETEVETGRTIAIDGTAGLVTLDDVELITPDIGDSFAEILGWADELRRLGVRANADSREDAQRARYLGAEGIGLCRTEHMFLGEDRDRLVRDMCIAAERWRQSRRSQADGGEGEDAKREFEQALEALGELQRSDFAEIFRVMAGLPVTIRLLDPPLHEFLPPEQFEAELEQAESEGDEAAVESARERLAIANELAETNPMLGTRGIRLAILFPQIYEMQVRAIAAAALEVGEDAEPPIVEIMLPLVAYERELEQVAALVRETVEAAAGRSGALRYEIGTMIELPRACLIAGLIAEHASFISFGTNDLTQTAAGLSRDDAEGRFLSDYLSRGLIDRSPFETVDVPGVGALVAIAVEQARKANPELKLGVCGEHGGDPDSIAFFHSQGLDYVSCSPYRIPIARVAAAQATLA